MLRTLARPLLASAFIAGGIHAYRSPSGAAQAAKPLIDRTLGSRTGSLPEWVPTDPETLVKLDAAVKVAAGGMLASGKFTRLAALALAGSAVPTTLAGHPFWQYEDTEQRNAQFMQFTKNASMLGGLLFAVLDTEGKPSLGWRTRRAADKVHRKANKATSKATKKAHKAAGHARLGAHDVRTRTTRALTRH